MAILSLLGKGMFKVVSLDVQAKLTPKLESCGGQLTSNGWPRLAVLLMASLLLKSPTAAI